MKVILEILDNFFVFVVDFEVVDINCDIKAFLFIIE